MANYQVVVVFFVAMAALLSAEAASVVGVNFALALQKRSPPLGVDVAAGLVFSAGFGKAKLFSLDVGYLAALDDAGIKEVMVAAPNFEIDALANTDGVRAAAVASLLAPFVLERGMRLTVAIGNEPLAPWPVFSGDARL